MSYVDEESSYKNGENITLVANTISAYKGAHISIILVRQKLTTLPEESTD